MPRCAPVLRWKGRGWGEVSEEGWDVLTRVWNAVVGDILGLAGEAAGKASLTPIDYLFHLRPEYVDLPDGVLRRAEEVLLDWKMAWAVLGDQYGGVQEASEEERDAIYSQFRELGQVLSRQELAAVVQVESSFAFKHTLIGGRWTEVCRPREDAQEGKRIAASGWVELDGPPPDLGETFHVRLRKLPRGVEVLVSRDRRSRGQVLGVGRKRGRLGRSFQGRLAVLGEVCPEACNPERTVIVPV